ncbi:MAG: hypothetical protein Q4F67_02090 [Propionibacteriaceae bacterium]|nr:hypothetical protein [Propionibacteriaceae bacterium]
MLPLWNPEIALDAARFCEDQRRQWSNEMTTEELGAWQERGVAATFDHCRAGSEFYREHLRGLETPSSLADLQQIPFTTKDDLRAHLDAVASLPLGQAWVYYETTGTTGVATPCPRTTGDSIRTGAALVNGYRQLLEPYGENLVFAVMGPTELHSTGDTFGDVLRSLGHATVKMWPHSPLVGFERACNLIKRLGVNALICTPGMTILLAREMLNRGIRPESLGIKVILTVGELASEGLLTAIGHTWGADVHSCMYASQEASILAVCQANGVLRSTPLNYFYELIDPQSGEVLDSGADARQGELVVTHLYQGAKPLLRYRTGDLVRIDGHGQDFELTPIGRVRDIVRVRDRNYFALDFERQLLQFAPRFLDYQVSIARDEFGDDRLDVVFEPGPFASESLVSYASYATQAFDVPVTATWGPTDARTATGAMVSWKAARIRDDRNDGFEERSSIRLAVARAGSSR